MDYNRPMLADQHRKLTNFVYLLFFIGFEEKAVQRYYMDLDKNKRLDRLIF